MNSYLTSAPALAQPADAGVFHAPALAVEGRPAVANFEGKSIDLAKGWEGAQACVSWRQLGVLDCFRTRGEMHARAAALQAGILRASAGCSSPLRLFESAGFGDREPWFYDRGYWQNLSDFGFDNQLSSYIVGACYSHLAEKANGSGYWYPGDTSPGAAEWSVSGGWNDRVSSVYLG